MKASLVRNTAGLRDALFEEWESLREGSSNPARARSIAMMANTILQSVQVEIEYHKYVSAIDNTANNKKAIDFGNATQVQLGQPQAEEKKAA
jgi:precorrin-3B methylase